MTVSPTATPSSVVRCTRPVPLALTMKDGEGVLVASMAGEDIIDAGRLDGDRWGEAAAAPRLADDGERVACPRLSTTNSTPSKASIDRQCPRPIAFQRSSSPLSVCDFKTYTSMWLAAWPCRCTRAMH